MLVITSPRRVTNPVTSEEGAGEVEKYLKAGNIHKIYPKGDILSITVDLLKKYWIKEQEIFDLQLVATMLCTGITHIYTFNRKDFSRFSEIEVLTVEAHAQLPAVGDLALSQNSRDPSAMPPSECFLLLGVLFDHLDIDMSRSLSRHLRLRLNPCFR